MVARVWMFVTIATAIGCGGVVGPQARRTPAMAPVRGEASVVAGPTEPVGPFSEESLMRDVKWLTDPARRGRGSSPEGAGPVADHIAAEFDKLGYEVVRQTVYPGVQSVFGIRRSGKGAVMVSAHYDHLGVVDGVVHPGADDNASGVAVLLALARDIANQPTKHSLIFAAFAAEEDGLVGSRIYLDKPIWPIADTAAVINYDMVGRQFFESGTRTPNTVGVLGLEADAGAKAVVLEASRRVGLRVVAARAGLIRLFGQAGRTDDWRFRARGIPAYHFSTGMHDDYHRPTDTVDKLDPAQLQRVARVSAELLSYLAER